MNATLPTRLFNNPAEPKSPKSMGQRIWDSSAKRISKKNWSYRSHPRTPKVTQLAPTVRFRMKPNKGFFIGTSEERFETLDAVKTELKRLGYLRFNWMGKLNHVG